MFDTAWSQRGLGELGCVDCRGLGDVDLLSAAPAGLIFEWKGEITNVGIYWSKQGIADEVAESIRNIGGPAVSRVGAVVTAGYSNLYTVITIELAYGLNSVGDLLRTVDEAIRIRGYSYNPNSVELTILRNPAPTQYPRLPARDVGQPTGSHTPAPRNTPSGSDSGSLLDWLFGGPSQSSGSGLPPGAIPDCRALLGPGYKWDAAQGRCVEDKGWLQNLADQLGINKTTAAFGGAAVVLLVLVAIKGR